MQLKILFLGHNIVTERSLSQLNESLSILFRWNWIIFTNPDLNERDCHSRNDISDVFFIKIIFQLVIDILEDPFRVCSTKKFLPTWVDLCGIQGVNNFPFFVYERKYMSAKKLIGSPSLLGQNLLKTLKMC